MDIMRAKKVFAVIFNFSSLFYQKKVFSHTFILILNKLEKIQIPAKTFSHLLIPITMT